MIQFITGNASKFAEASQILTGIELRQLDIDLPEMQEIDPHKIIEAKLLEARKHHHGEIIVEDTSLYLEALGGKLPGPMIKWFMKGIGNEGISDIASRFGVHGARAVNLIGYMDKNDNIRYFEGEVVGNVVCPRGENAFGWDPIFQPDGSILTFGQMSKEAKNAISHRQKALKKLEKYLNERN